MNSTTVYALALGIGLIAGLRSMTAPAVVCWAVHLNWLDLHGTRLVLLGSPETVAIVTLLAIGELVADKLPSTPNRTTAFPLFARVLMGALCGAAICVGGGASIRTGAAIGAVAGVAGAFAGYSVRHALVQNLKLPDGVVAVAEDLIATGCGLLLVSRF
jgi:uncharacterized membrane protein